MQWPSLSSCFSNIQIRHEVAVKIKNLNKRIGNISKDKVFTSLTSTQPTVTVSVRKQRSTSLVEPNLVGKEVIHACSKVVDLVHAHKENSSYKLAIVGTGGVGKTTLAQKIYNDQKLKGSFNKRAWVCVSKGLCFIYCAMYPKDAVLFRDDIVRMWVAEGFVDEQGDKLLEDIAEEHYYELIQRNLLQPDYDYADLTHCRMHDMLRQLACYLSREECFVGEPESTGVNVMSKF
jgi:hypothetical protein